MDKHKPLMVNRRVELSLMAQALAQPLVAAEQAAVGYDIVLNLAEKHKWNAGTTKWLLSKYHDAVIECLTGPKSQYAKKRADLDAAREDLDRLIMDLTTD